MDDRFIDIKYGYKTMDIYLIRRSIFRSIQSVLPLFKGQLLDIGCGKMPYKNYILNNSNVAKYTGLDIESALEYDKAVRPDYVWNGITMPFDSESFDCALGTEVLEHCFDPEIILNEVYRVLKPEGMFFFTVPFIWNLHEVPFDAYRYTPFAIKRILESSGFRNVEIHAYGGWHSSLGQMLALWVKRSPIHKYIRLPLTLFLMPIICLLLRIGEKDFGHSNFLEGDMFPGMYGICRK